MIAVRLFRVARREQNSLPATRCRCTAARARLSDREPPCLTRSSPGICSAKIAYNASQQGLRRGVVPDPPSAWLFMDGAGDVAARIEVLTAAEPGVTALSAGGRYAHLIG